MAVSQRAVQLTSKLHDLQGQLRRVLTTLRAGPRGPSGFGSGSEAGSGSGSGRASSEAVGEAEAKAKAVAPVGVVGLLEARASPLLEVLESWSDYTFGSVGSATTGAGHGVRTHSQRAGAGAGAGVDSEGADSSAGSQQEDEEEEEEEDERRRKRFKTSHSQAQSQNDNKFKRRAVQGVGSLGGRKKRLRSRNRVVDQWLGEEGGADNYADLEDFLV